MTTETISSAIFDELQTAIEAVIPIPIDITRAGPVDRLHSDDNMYVLITLTGDFPSHIIFEASSMVLSAVSERMYGMALEGDMLESFAGEVGNIIAGATTTGVSQSGVTLNIGPPVVVTGHSKLSGFHHGSVAELTLVDVGSAKISLVWD